MRMIVLLGAMLTAGVAQAQVFKCVDRAGKTVYSQAPCPTGAKSATLQKTAPPPAPAPAPAASAAAAKGDAAKGDAAKGDAAKKASGPKTAAEMEQDFRKRQQAQDEARKKQEQTAAESRAKEDNCRTARNALAGLEAGGRQARFNDKGERFFLDEAQIEAEKDRARKVVSDSCK